MLDNLTQNLMRQLLAVWAEFESKLNTVAIIDKINREKITLEDYKLLLLNHRNQVIDGASWITRAASNIGSDYLHIRSAFIKHAATEQHDYQMLENNYLAVGGNEEEFQNSQKNIGSEALSAWMFHRASLPNPFDLLGAMFIIEGLGNNKASHWANKIMNALDLEENAVGFYLYHGKNDSEHMQELEEVFNTDILEIAGMSEAIVKTAKVTGRLYLLQLSELGNY